jgi:ankyrin repeat protein
MVNSHAPASRLSAHPNRSRIQQPKSLSQSYKLHLSVSPDTGLRRHFRKLQTFLSANAALNGHEAVVQLLLENGAEADVENEDGRTVLYYTAVDGQEAVAWPILKKAAAIDGSDKEGRMALDYAAVNGHKAVVQQLL